MYAPPAADGPNSAHTCGIEPDARTWVWKILPAPRRPGNISTWSVMRAPAESTSQISGSSWRSAYSSIRMIFSTVRAPQEPALTADRAHPGDHPVGRQVPGHGVGQQAVLDHGVGVVEQAAQALAHEQLALLPRFGVVPLRAARASLLGERRERRLGALPCLDRLPRRLALRHRATPWLLGRLAGPAISTWPLSGRRSEEHTSELQSRFDLVCRLLLEKKK